MITALDNNIISGLLAPHNPSNLRIRDALKVCQQQGPLLISAPVYAELLAYPGMTVAKLDAFLVETAIDADFAIDQPIWTLAGQRYAHYAIRRRRATGEGPRRLPADFLIGAHALKRADRLFTLDIKVYRQDFPELLLFS